MTACDWCGLPGVHGGVPGHRQGQVEGEPPHRAHHLAEPAACQRGCTFRRHFTLCSRQRAALTYYDYNNQFVLAGQYISTPCIDNIWRK